MRCQDYYLVCEPAQNLIHREQIVRDGTRLRLAARQRRGAA
jgi:hypothetical protein